MEPETVGAPTTDFFLGFDTKAPRTPDELKQEIDEQVQELDELDGVQCEVSGPLSWQSLDWGEIKLEEPEETAAFKLSTQGMMKKLEEQENDLEDEFQAIQDAILLNQPSPYFRSHWEPYIEGPDVEDRQNAILDEFPLQYLEPDPEAYERRKKALLAFKK